MLMQFYLQCQLNYILIRQGNDYVRESCLIVYLSLSKSYIHPPINSIFGCSNSISKTNMKVLSIYHHSQGNGLLHQKRKHKNKTETQKCIQLSRNKKELDTFLNFARNSISVTLNFTRFALIVKPLSTVVASELSFSNKVSHEFSIGKQNESKNILSECNKHLPFLMNEKEKITIWERCN